MTKGKAAMLMALLGAAVCALDAHARGFRVGYGLVYSVTGLSASRIDDAFADLAPGGHSSSFYLETPLWEGLSLIMSPGAMNFEDGESQLHAQYNMLSLRWKTGWPLFPAVGCGIGGCIATLSKAPGDSGTAQSGSFLRNTVFIWTGSLGLGYRFGNGLEISIEGRRLGFIDAAMSSLDSYNVGATVSVELRPREGAR